LTTLTKFNKMYQYRLSAILWHWGRLNL